MSEISLSELSFEEVEELLNIILNVHGYDFRNYSPASFKRRLIHVMNRYQLDVFSLKQQLINNEPFFQTFLNEVTVNVTELFRDPSFYISVRTQVLPYLSSYPHIKIWNAGCSSGEETYSFAMMMKEEGVYDKSFIYGTDISTRMLDKAAEGIYDLSKLKNYSANYHAAGGRYSLSDYYHAAYDAAIFNADIKKNMLFSVHNLAMDKVFNEFQLVVCRNVLIYFENDLQEKVIQLFYDSLCPLGFLCLGSKESIRNIAMKKYFKVIDRKENIYQKVG
jgi:chemotaxis protein methyltransferase CheR